MEDGNPKIRPRDRIVGTACDLFRKHGIKGIGVDAIVEAASTNKMTLYRHFKSKDELIAACMRDQAERAEAWWTGLEEAHPGDPLAQLHGWARGTAECVAREGRGCNLANAAVELPENDHPARRVVEDYKRSQHRRLADLCKAAGARDPGMLADTLWLLVEGARVSRQSVGPDGPSAHFVTVAESLIASAVDSGSSGPRRTRKAAAPKRKGGARAGAGGR
jgi:AcrR family transcriptional regulator